MYSSHTQRPYSGPGANRARHDGNPMHSHSSAPSSSCPRQRARPGATGQQTHTHSSTTDTLVYAHLSVGFGSCRFRRAIASSASHLSHQHCCGRAWSLWHLDTFCFYILKPATPLIPAGHPLQYSPSLPLLGCIKAGQKAPELNSIRCPCQPGAAMPAAHGQLHGWALWEPGSRRQPQSFDSNAIHRLASSSAAPSPPSLNPTIKKQLYGFNTPRKQRQYPLQPVAIPCAQAHLPREPSHSSPPGVLPHTTPAAPPTLQSTPPPPTQLTLRSPVKQEGASCKKVAQSICTLPRRSRTRLDGTSWGALQSSAFGRSTGTDRLQALRVWQCLW